MKVTAARLALLNIAISILAIVGWLLFFQASSTIETIHSQPTPTMSFEHRWGECTLHLWCDKCLNNYQRLNSSLSVCWEQTNMDRHMEIFGR